MRSFFIASSKTFVVSFLAIAVCFAGFCELYLRWCVTPQEPIAKIVTKVYESEQSSAIFGDSQTQAAFPEEVAGYANLSKGGLNVPMIDQLARQFFRHRQGRAILLASPHMFAKYRLQRNASHWQKYFGQNLGQKNFIALFEPGIAQFLGSGKNYLRSTTPTSDDLSKSWSAVDAAERLRKTQERVEWQTPVTGFTDSADFKTYAQLLEYLAKKEIDVCLLRPPVTDAYQTYADAIPAFRAAERELRKLADRHGLLFLDYRDLDQALTNQDFSNQDHLNRTGQAKFAKAAITRCAEHAAAAL